MSLSESCMLSRAYEWPLQATFAESSLARRAVGATDSASGCAVLRVAPADTPVRVDVVACQVHRCCPGRRIHMERSGADR